MGEKGLYKFKETFTEKHQDINISQEEENSTVFKAPPLLEEARTGISSDKSDIHREIEGKMPLKLLAFTNLSEYITKGFYTYKGFMGKDKKATRSPSRGYMKPLLENLAALDSFLQEPIPKNADTNAIAVDALAGVDVKFEDTLKACDLYLEKRKNPWSYEGKARYAMVEYIREKVAYESARFKEKITELKKDPTKYPEDGTYLSLLTDIRTVKYEDKKDGVNITTGGAGTSEIIVIEKDGVKHYVKEREMIPEADPGIYMQEEMERLKKAMADAGDNDRSYYKNCHDYIQLLFGQMKEEYGSVEMFFSRMHNFFAKKSLNPNADEVYDFLERQFPDIISKNLKKKGREKEFLGNFFLKLKRDNLMRKMATSKAQIGEKEEMSKRNVATKRLAEMLKIGDLVVDTKMVELNVNGKNVKGIMMEHAEGVNQRHFLDQVEKEKKKASYSLDAYRQLLNLQVFDVICGQVDRNSNNYLCSYKTDEEGNYVIDKVTAIDNDMSFGTLTYEQFNQLNQYGPTLSIEVNGRMTIPAMDREFADAILALKPEFVENMMLDILSKSEIAALIDRITGVQRAIQNRMRQEDMKKYHHLEYVTKFPKNKEEWEKHKKITEERAHKNAVNREMNVKIANDKNKTQAERDKAKRNIDRIDDDDISYKSYLEPGYLEK